jgi:Domain of unknown function (DUF4278)
MKLRYRGGDYEYNPVALDVGTREISGKYRGQLWKQHFLTHNPIPQLEANLKYRGVSYHVGNTPLTEVVEILPVVSNQVVSTHLLNLRLNLERRLMIAKASGDEHLVNLLQEEAKQLVL